MELFCISITNRDRRSDKLAAEVGRTRSADKLANDVGSAVDLEHEVRAVVDDAKLRVSNLQHIEELSMNIVCIRNVMNMTNIMSMTNPMTKPLEKTKEKLPRR